MDEGNRGAAISAKVRRFVQLRGAGWFGPRNTRLTDLTDAYDRLC